MVCFWIISVGLYSSFWLGCRSRHDIDQTRAIQGGSPSIMKWNNDASVKGKPLFFPTSLHIFSYDQKLFGLDIKNSRFDVNNCFCHSLDFLSFSSPLNPRTTSPNLIHNLFALGILAFEWQKMKILGCLIFGPSEFFKALTIPKMR